MTAPRSRRRRGTGRELREVLVRVAADLLAQLGDVDALTMRAAAIAAGVTAPSVYRHFPDKESLVAAVIAERFDAFTGALRAAADAAGRRSTRASPRGDGPSLRSRGTGAAGHYRVLFSATNAGPAGLGPHPRTEHLGAASYRTLVETVTACLPPARRGEALLFATELWASLHGVVD